MGIHSGWSRFLPTLNGNVMTTGGSLNLAKGQMGIFNIKKPTKNGLAAISDFAGLSDRTQLQLRVGNQELQLARTQGNKNKETRTFRINEIESLEVNVPSKKTFDKLIVGYDGINADTALDFEVGDNDVLEITLRGKAIGVLGYEDAEAKVTTYFEKTSEDQTNQEIVEKAIQLLKDNVLKEMVPVTEFIDIDVVNSENPASETGTVEHTYYNLAVTDTGDSNALGNVQAQYGDLTVKPTERNGLTTVYTVLRPTSEGLPSAFVQSTASVLKGCEDCPSGFTAEDGGFIYYVSLEDNGEDDTIVIQGDGGTTEDGLPGAITDSAIKQGQENGVGIYAVAVDDELTQAEIDTFVTANPTAVIELVGETADICNNSTTSTIAWTAGDACDAKTETYKIQLADDECGEDKLAELQAAYPDLTIAIDADGGDNTNGTGGCQTLYETSVTTDIVCEDCDPIFRGLFESEAPADYGDVSWTKEDKVYNEDALMGIKITGKDILSNPPEYLRDNVPFIDSSTRISVAGGQYTGQSFSYKEGGERFAVKILERASDPTNLGGHLWALEDRDNIYFNGTKRHTNGINGYQNEYAKMLLGEESVLKGGSQYVIYNLKVSPESRSQGFAGILKEGFTYMIAAEVGKHKGVEDLLNSLAAAAGLPTVRAYGNQS